MNTNTVVKKIARFLIYGTLLGIVGLFGFIFLRKKDEYRITLGPPDGTASDLLGTSIPYANAEAADSADSASAGSADSSSASDTTM